MTYRHYAILGPDSEISAAAAECAFDQGRFWEYYTKLFENQGSASFNKDNLKRFAFDLAFDLPTFNHCLDTDKHLELVRAETRANTEKGVTSTPTFFINGQKIVGAQPYEQFERVINIFLKK